MLLKMLSGFLHNHSKDGPFAYHCNTEAQNNASTLFLSAHPPQTTSSICPSRIHHLFLKPRTDTHQWLKCCVCACARACVCAYVCVCFIVAWTGLLHAYAAANKTDPSEHSGEKYNLVVPPRQRQREREREREREGNIIGGGQKESKMG